MTQNVITQSVACNEKVKGQSSNLYLDNVMENENYVICIKLEESVSKLNFKEL